VAAAEVFDRGAPLVRSLREAGRAAAERLAGPGCARLLSDFKDASGRTLQQRLDELGRSAVQQLQSIYFYDGAHSAAASERRRSPSRCRRAEWPDLPGIQACSNEITRQGPLRPLIPTSERPDDMASRSRRQR
jgi:hypothetical protein